MGLLQFFSHHECQDDSCQNCEEMPKFIKVTAKNIAGTFFRDTVYIACLHYGKILSQADGLTALTKERTKLKICLKCKHQNFLTVKNVTRENRKFVEMRHEISAGAANFNT